MGKVMLIAFFDSHNFVYQRYVTPKSTVNKEYYRDVLEKLHYPTIIISHFGTTFVRSLYLKFSL